jgi:hypothetical protein
MHLQSNVIFLILSLCGSWCGSRYFSEASYTWRWPRLLQNPAETPTPVTRDPSWVEAPVAPTHNPANPTSSSPPHNFIVVHRRLPTVQILLVLLLVCVRSSADCKCECNSTYWWVQHVQQVSACYDKGVKIISFMTVKILLSFLWIICYKQWKILNIHEYNGKRSVL